MSQQKRTTESTPLPEHGWRKDMVKAYEEGRVPGAAGYLDPVATAREDRLARDRDAWKRSDGISAEQVNAAAEKAEAAKQAQLAKTGSPEAGARSSCKQATRWVNKGGGWREIPVDSDE
jgi:hypothetical protein